ncbi:MAG: hypothetical protein ACREND_03805 [Gemmatimonadaceae bacterium]
MRHFEGEAALDWWRVRRSAAAACVAIVIAACSGNGRKTSPNDRGAGLQTAKLSADAQAAAYAAALGAAFDLGPQLVLLLDPALLPRQRDAEPSDTIPIAVSRALASRGAIQGSCTAAPSSPRVAPICKAQAAGYEVRFSPVFRLTHDAIQVYLTAERYRATADTAGYQPPLQFERRYALVKSGRQWRVAREERLTH